VTRAASRRARSEIQLAEGAAVSVAVGGGVMDSDGISVAAMRASATGLQPAANRKIIYANGIKRLRFINSPLEYSFEIVPLFGKNNNLLRYPRLINNSFSCVD
jgi:hypothetical protein